MLFGCFRFNVNITKKNFLIVVHFLNLIISTPINNIHYTFIDIKQQTPTTKQFKERIKVAKINIKIIIQKANFMLRIVFQKNQNNIENCNKVLENTILSNRKKFNE